VLRIVPLISHVAWCVRTCVLNRFTYQMRARGRSFCLCVTCGHLPAIHPGLRTLLFEPRVAHSSHGSTVGTVFPIPDALLRAFVLRLGGTSPKPHLVDSTIPVVLWYWFYPHAPGCLRFVRRYSPRLLPDYRCYLTVVLPLYWRFIPCFWIGCCVCTHFFPVPTAHFSGVRARCTYARVCLRRVPLFGFTRSLLPPRIRPSFVSPPSYCLLLYPLPWPRMRHLPVCCILHSFVLFMIVALHLFRLYILPVLYVVCHYCHWFYLHIPTHPYILVLGGIHLVPNCTLQFPHIHNLPTIILPIIDAWRLVKFFLLDVPFVWTLRLWICDADSAVGCAHPLRPLRVHRFRLLRCAVPIIRRYTLFQFCASFPVLILLTFHCSTFAHGRLLFVRFVARFAPRRLFGASALYVPFAADRLRFAIAFCGCYVQHAHYSSRVCCLRIVDHALSLLPRLPTRLRWYHIPRCAGTFYLFVD